MHNPGITPNTKKFPLSFEALHAAIWTEGYPSLEERANEAGGNESADTGARPVLSGTEGGETDPERAGDTLPVVADEAAPKPPATVATGGKCATAWKDVEVCFLDAEHVQVTELGQVRRLSYAEMGFGDRRGIKVGDRGANKAWGWFRKIAEERGTIELPERQGAPVRKGPRDAARQPKSSHEGLIEERAGAAKARENLQVAMKGLRRSLCAHFEIKDNPILFEQARYRAQFRIGCSPLYHQ